MILCFLLLILTPEKQHIGLTKKSTKISNMDEMNEYINKYFQEKGGPRLKDRQSTKSDESDDIDFISKKKKGIESKFDFIEEYLNDYKKRKKDTEEDYEYPSKTRKTKINFDFDQDDLQEQPDKKPKKIFDGDDQMEYKHNDDSDSRLPPNTILRDGQIVCMEGYISDSEIETKGCWKCSKECHKNAHCAESGRCVCNSGFLGDGIKSCEKKSLKITSAKVDNNNILTVIINYIDPGAIGAFCRIDGEKSDAISIEDDTIRCLIPETKTKVSKVAVSLDEKLWSNNYYLEPKSNSLIIGLIVLGLAVVVLAVFFCKSKKRDITKQPKRFLQNYTVKLNQKLGTMENDENFNVYFEPVMDDNQ
ncbi:hypothetical protein GPJ56_010538 [Histomonas meleagridis]|uniref:uncharacterized protein n=1 Tax=Histomonas meleagridis TaxID=135588 RepID=UPI00355AC34C|nr:hypothetical protein GPJ56_010538 [Histomonas meleagridis]KAH0798005.1 hypothetical protein GO595_009224 [Histomonas meleagridis]